MEQRPNYAMELAVKGMLPKNTIGRAALTRLKLYQGRGAQQRRPEARSLDSRTNQEVSRTMYESKKQYQYGTGRRKSSVARVRVYENGTGSIIINGRDIDDYFGLETLKLLVRQPLVTTDTLGKVDIVCTVAGGGVTGQAGAIRHGVARALLQVNPEYRAPLKAAGLPDPRPAE